MKKLFFFRSSNGNNNQVSPTSADKQMYREKTTEKVNKHSRTSKHGSEDQIFGDTPCLRRSLSFSSGSFCETEKKLRNYGNQNGSPCSSSYYSHKQSGRQSSGSRTLTPERRTGSKRFDASMAKNAQNSDFIVFKTQSETSELSSYSSSNVSSKVLDRYIDGEQQMERNDPKSIFSMRNHCENGNLVLTRPPRFHSTQQKPKSQSFRETSVPQSRESEDEGFYNESPRKLAKHVVERLSQSQFVPKARSKNHFDPDNPITIEDVYSRSINRSPRAYNNEDISEFSGKESFSCINGVTEADMELLQKYKEAEDRATFLSEELVQENFLQIKGLSVPMLLQTIRSLMEEKANMALEVSEVLQDRISEKALLKEELKLERLELEAQIRKLEKEKNELQLILEKQLERRSTEWAHKLEKYQTEEHRLRERVRELAEQNVCLQRDVSSFSERQTDTRMKITVSEQKLEELSVQLNEVKEENDYMKRCLSELQEKSRAAEEDRDCFKRNYEEKVNECKDMHRAVSRLQRTCIDQEKTIDGLRGLCGELENQKIFDFGLKKLQTEHMRLTGVEHALRNELESYRVKVDSLRHENIDLLNRLKGKDGNFSTFKLDRELQSRISSLEKEMLPLLINSSKLCRKLLDFVKMNGFGSPKKGDTGLNVQDVVECEVKLQGFERAAESLTSSTQTMSSVVQEKSIFSDEPNSSEESQKGKSENIIISELKAEELLTSLLREKLYSNEVEMEQLKAELAACVRCNDILKCEVQNAMDNFSCVNHKTKDLELQMMKKDEIIKRLQDDLQECKKELAVVRGILPKITEERDVMWEEVKQCSEKNMLLDSENNTLRKKIELLDEEILLKEGQITILRDSLSKPFDLLDSTDKFWKN